MFVKHFGKPLELMDQEKTCKIGDFAYLEKDNIKIYYLITKEKYYNKPTIETLKKTLLKLCEDCEKQNINTLFMPKLGCGLDKLNWKKVKSIIFEIFSPIKTKIIIVIKK